MKNLCYLGALLLLIACDSGMKKEVTASYPNGKPMRSEETMYVGDYREVVGETRYYPNGKVEMEGDMENGNRHGQWNYYKNDGFKWMEETYADGRLNGLSRVWYRSGKLNYEGNYLNGKPDGSWVFYRLDGSKAKTVEYNQGVMVNSKIH